MLFTLQPDGTHRRVHGNGKHITLTDAQILEILNHANRKNSLSTPTTVELCQQMGISRTTYYRIIGGRAKHRTDRERIESLADSVGYKIKA